MVDLSKIVDIEKIRTTKEQLQGERVLNARLSGWEEMFKYISSLEEGILDTQSQMQQGSEYLSAQAETLQMIKSFITNRVQLISPEHPLAQTDKKIAATV